MFNDFDISILSNKNMSKESLLEDLENFIVEKSNKNMVCLE